MSNTQNTQEISKSNAILSLLRALFHLGVVGATTNWGFTANPLPHPGLLYGFSALIGTILIWALFLSPHPVLRTEKFLQALVDLLFIGLGTIALLATQSFPIWLPIAFGVIGMTVSYLVFMAKGKRQ